MVAYRAGAPVRVPQFLSEVRRVAAALGSASHVLNACADRYHFTVGFAASLLSGKVSLLPSTHTPDVMRQLRLFAPDVICLSDEAECTIALPRVTYPRADARADDDPLPGAAAGAVPAIDAAQLAAWVFTSGSTGTPLPYRKTLGPLIGCVRVEAERLNLSGGAPCAIVATVPPQHMYGFETSVLLPMANGHALSAERPFYPADIAAALEAVPRPRLLVSTPVHLRALLASRIALPQVDLIVSATAPLTQQLAAEAEARFDTQLLEIYGSTETGEIAARRPTHTAEWRLWPGVRLSLEGENSWAQGGHIEQRSRLYDVLEVTGGGRFLLHGRVTDLVNIAGKRSSLSLPQPPAELDSRRARWRVLPPRGVARLPHWHRARRRLRGGPGARCRTPAAGAARAHRSGVPAAAAAVRRAAAAQQHRQASAGGALRLLAAANKDEPWAQSLSPSLPSIRRSSGIFPACRSFRRSCSCSMRWYVPRKRKAVLPVHAGGSARRSS